jgi:hypothetical protein
LSSGDHRLKYFARPESNHAHVHDSIQSEQQHQQHQHIDAIAS